MVLEGLPRKAHEVFKILALHQVQTSKGMIFQDLFRARYACPDYPVEEDWPAAVLEWREMHRRDHKRV